MALDRAPKDLAKQNSGALQDEVVDKTLGNTKPSDLVTNVPDAKVFGDPEAWVLLSKAYSQAEGWMHSTKAYQIPRVGVVLQTISQQRNPDRSYGICQSTTFVPGAKIQVTGTDAAGNVTGRSLTHV